MKKNQFSIFILFIVMIIACDKDNNKNELFVDHIHNLILDKESIDLKVGEQATININDGSGDYKAFSLNPDIAEIKISDTEISLNGLKNGKTFLIVSDKENGYKNIPIIVYTHDETILSNNDVELEYKLGTIPTKPILIDIEQGNGDYKITSDNEIFDVKLSSDEKQIIIYVRGKGEGNITLTDYKGLTSTIKVKSIETTKPYSNEELELIKAQDYLVFKYENDAKYNASTTWLNYHNTIEDGKQLYGYSYSEQYFEVYYKIYYEGDKSVGKKKNAIFHFKALTATPKLVQNQPIELEIIKNDSKKIWAIFSFVKENRVYAGYFIQNINP